MSLSGSHPIHLIHLNFITMNEIKLFYILCCHLSENDKIKNIVPNAIRYRSFISFTFDFRDLSQLMWTKFFQQLTFPDPSPFWQLLSDPFSCQLWTVLRWDIVLFVCLYWSRTWVGYSPFKWSFDLQSYGTLTLHPGGLESLKMCPIKLRECLME